MRIWQVDTQDEEWMTILMQSTTSKQADDDKGETFADEEAKVNDYEMFSRLAL